VPYWFANTGYHAVFTVAIPIALTGLLFPSHRNRPYMGRFGLTTTAIVMALGVLVLRVSVPPSEDPGYQAPPAFVIGCLAVVLVVGVLALTAVPAPNRPVTAARVPGLWPLGLASGLATLVFFALTFPVFGARQPAFTEGLWVLAPLAAAAIGIAWGYRTLLRWTDSREWTDRHTLALIGGALVAHSVGGMVIMAHNAVDRSGLAAIIALTLLAVYLIDRRLRAREALAAA